MASAKRRSWKWACNWCSISAFLRREPSCTSPIRSSGRLSLLNQKMRGGKVVRAHRRSRYQARASSCTWASSGSCGSISRRSHASRWVASASVARRHPSHARMALRWAFPVRPCQSHASNWAGETSRGCARSSTAVRETSRRSRGNRLSSWKHCSSTATPNWLLGVFLVSREHSSTDSELDREKVLPAHRGSSRTLASWRYFFHPREVMPVFRRVEGAACPGPTEAQTHPSVLSAAY
jgi:hypothetical protein